MATKTDENGPFKEFVFEDWVRDGVKGIYGEIKDCCVEPFSARSFRRHLHNARREQLLAMRSLIDRAIEHLDKKEAHQRKA